jgi:hypothetical protein
MTTIITPNLPRVVDAQIVFQGQRNDEWGVRVVWSTGDEEVIVLQSKEAAQSALRRLRFKMN